MGFTILIIKDTCATGMLRRSCLEKLTLYLQNVPVAQKVIFLTHENL